MASNHGEPSTAPQPNRWYDLRLGSSCRDPSPTAKFCTLRYEFKPASIDKTQAGSLQKTKDNRVTVEFHNNQPGKPKVTFEGTHGSHEEYKDTDGVLFFDGETFRLERLHRAVKRLRHVRVPGESTAATLAATTTGTTMESHSPPLAKVGKSQAMSKPAAPSVPVEVERIDIGEPENPGPRHNNKGTTYQSVTKNAFSLSTDPNGKEENLDILGDDGTESPNNMASAQGTAIRGFDINLPNQFDTDDEIADVDVNDEADEGLNAAEALRAQVNAEGQQEQQETSSSSGSSSSSSSGSGSGSGSGSSSSDSDGSDGDSASSGGYVDI